MSASDTYFPAENSSLGPIPRISWIQMGWAMQSVCRKGAGMKKRIVGVLFLGMALLTGRSQEGHRVAHAGPPIENGNVNGDNDTDLSDAIYLLAHLFQGGSAPVECTPGAGGTGGGPTDPQLPTTGQAFCYNVEETPIPGAMGCAVVPFEPFFSYSVTVLIFQSEPLSLRI